MVNVGLVTGTPTPSARHAPRTNVVLPAPSSPEMSTTSPGCSPAASAAARASVSAAAAVSVSTLAAGMRPAPQREAGEQERDAGGGEREDVEAGAGDCLGGGRLGRGALDLKLGGSELRLGLALVARLVVGCGRGCRRRRLGPGLRRLLEPVGGLLVARAGRLLGERRGRRGEREGRGERGDAGPGPHDGRWYRRARMSPARRILDLTDRDWTPPRSPENPPHRALCP